MTGKTIKLDVKVSDTIAKIKEMVSAKDGKRVDQRLTFVGPLDDDQTLASYNVQANSTIMEVGRLLGGARNGSDVPVPQDTIESIETQSN